MTELSTAASPTTLPEIAFYYPGHVWKSSEWIKNLVLFFDGVGLLKPNYRPGPEIFDPAIAIPLQEHGLLRILSAETVVDRSSTEKLAEAMTDLIASGALDSLPKSAEFHALSYSRLGGYGDPALAN